MPDAPLDANKRKLEELREKRNKRNQIQTTSTAEQEKPTFENKIERREHSLQKSEGIHISGSEIDTIDIDIQCQLETRSLDGKAHKDLESELEDKDNALLQPKEHKRKKEEKEDLKIRPLQELNQEEISSMMKTKHFSDFFHRSSKFMEKVLDHGEADMIELLLADGIKSKDKDQNILAHSVCLYDKNYTADRVVTDLDWSSQISELFLTSYSENEEGGIKDHVGVVLIWNPLLKNQPQSYCFCQSAVTSAKFFPYSNKTVIGGCYNGQLLLWDFREKKMPVQRSGISADAHKYPVNSLNVIGTQVANEIISFSNDGTICKWDIKQFSRTISTSKLKAQRPSRISKPPASTSAVRNSRLPQSNISSSVLDRNKEETHDINVTCCQFLAGDANNYYAGSLNGAMYKNALYNKSTDPVVMYDEHDGPISAISVNNPSEFEELSGLILTSSFDWTVKLWPANEKESIRTFENSQDYVYDVQWNPTNPSIFATVNNEGYLDIFDLTKNVELPIAHQKVSSSAQNKCKWNQDGSVIITGDSAGNSNVFVLAEKYRKPDAAKIAQLEHTLVQNKEVF